MKMNLQSYVRIYSGIVEPNVCKQTIEDLRNVNWLKHEYTSVSDYSSRSINGENELSVTFEPISTKNYIESKVWEAYKNYIMSLNFQWFNGWKSFTDVRFNRYDEGQIMTLHCDHINSIFDGERKGVPIMTALGCLNEDYEGGDLTIFDDSFIKMKTGDIVVFPSNFLFPHKVNPVLKGTRYSFVCWAW
jgi:predicted 2-oxoglutarate/Fe(II)-dependent dioxygenase YbiX